MKIHRASKFGVRPPARAALLALLAGVAPPIGATATGLGVALWASAAHAEGTTEWGSAQALVSDTVMFVDIVNFSVEKIKWTGTGTLTVKTLSGSTVATLSSGSSTSLTANGTYALTLSKDQSSTWSVEVVNQTDAGYGRLWSYNWHLNTGTFEDTGSFNGSVYAVVSAGSTDTAVIEMQTDGLSGNVWYLGANASGIDGANGRSSASGTFTPSFPIYLNPPTNSTYSFTAPSISAPGFSGEGECDSIAPGVTTGEFTFTSSTDGVGHIICDLNGDGAYDITSDDDLHIVFDVIAGANSVAWDGTDNLGAALAEGTYTCKGLVTVGEFHYVGRDIETSYKGFRLFYVDSALARIR